LLGLLVAVSLGLVDALGNVTPGRVLQLALGVLVGGIIGALGGFLGGAVGQVLLERFQLSLFLGVGLPVTGLLLRAAPGLFELLLRVAREEGARGAVKKTVNGLLGGALGGLIGGVLFLLLKNGLGWALHDESEDFWTPTAVGFVVLGLCIGLLIGLA